MSKFNFYVVWQGRIPGVYSSWPACQEQIDGFPNARLKGFFSERDAVYAFSQGWQEYYPKYSKLSFKGQRKKSSSNIKIAPIQDIQSPCICVDGSWNCYNKVFEYKAIHYPSNTRIFERGPMNGGTNNIAEFLAIVEALIYCKNNLINLPVYTDSKTALAWIRKKKCNTKRDSTLIPQNVRDSILNAEKWLEENEYENNVLKWQTQLWGENPADFGRK